MFSYLSPLSEFFGCLSLTSDVASNRLCLQKPSPPTSQDRRSEPKDGMWRRPTRCHSNLKFRSIECHPAEQAAANPSRERS
jgi:hypothetical protein